MDPIRLRLRRLCEIATPGMLVPVADLRVLLDECDDSLPEPAPVTIQVEPTWRERLWTAPAEARLGVPDVAEAIGRPRSWVYRHTSTRSGCPVLPHRKLDGELLFTAGEIRAWLRDHEAVMRYAAAAATPTKPSDRIRRLK